VTDVRFFYDLGSPYAYLAAERMHSVVAEPVEWSPILLGAVFKATGRKSWAAQRDSQRQTGIEEIERRARSYGLPPLRWPPNWPSDYLVAARAATYAKRVGREREFAIAAFRHAFADGADLSQPDAVLDAAAASGLDRDEVAAAVVEPDIKLALREATDAALELGVIGVPTVVVDGVLFWGDDRLEEAAARVR
jgi:2-hydroxychromene-2-carboxylate isomerase